MTKMNKDELRNYIKVIDLDMAELQEKRNEAVAEFQRPGYFAMARQIFCNNPQIDGKVALIDVPEDECVGVAIFLGEAPAHYFIKRFDLYDIRCVRWTQNNLVLSVHFPN